jgi:hypothetical protein
MTKQYSVFHIEGGLGKHIAATAVARAIKNNHPDRELIIVCAWPQIFINLQFVDRVYKIGNAPYFYQNYIHKQDSLIFKHEPYFTTSHIHKEKSLVESWCNLYQLEYKGEQPELVFNLREIQKSSQLLTYDKPPLFIQSNGGPFSEDSGYQYRWTRDLPFSVTQTLTSKFSKDYTVFQVARPNSPIATGAVAVNAGMDVMEYLSLLLHSRKRVLIDSSLQHAARALNLKSTVLWIGTSPKIFGYDYHDNIQSMEPPYHKLPDSYLFDFDFEGNTYQYPYGETDDIFNLDDIVQSVENQ